ncbi:LysE family translocator [Peribacillus acanthi]|uniref:LysE family translocator n=1 Tax=Peribacillus acanthi TaxID=2171554 RepID=UPI000D3E15E5|nr:LysE family translocator [Peribacillus acanthi]
MLGITNFEWFLISSILLNITPGADTMYIVSRSVSQGRRAGIYSALGISSGALVHTILAAFGLSVILMKSVWLFTVIKIVGAGYLIYLGIRMLLEKKNTVRHQDNLDKLSKKKIFLQGLITNVTNPKVALFFLAFIPQFINTGSSSPIPFLILGLTFTMTGGLWCVMIAIFSSLATKGLRDSNHIQYILNKLTGIVFIAMGIKLFKTKATA